LNIADAPMPVMGLPLAAPVASTAAPVEEEKPKEKTEFAIKLEKFDAASKAKVIRELKALIPGMNLVEVNH
jgi:large subunit ribosomal protein L7/L12